MTCYGYKNDALIFAEKTLHTKDMEYIADDLVSVDENDYFAILKSRRGINPNIISNVKEIHRIRKMIPNL